jgi:hypothetical protein
MDVVARQRLVERSRALPMLFVFSNVRADDAPTRIGVGSHVEMARTLVPAGESGRANWLTE